MQYIGKAGRQAQQRRPTLTTNDLRRRSIMAATNVTFLGASVTEDQRNAIQDALSGPLSVIGDLLRGAIVMTEEQQDPAIGITLARQAERVVEDIKTAAGIK
jgi:hypothetical protein